VPENVRVLPSVWTADSTTETVLPRTPVTVTVSHAVVAKPSAYLANPPPPAMRLPPSDHAVAKSRRLIAS
jgi:hypothetical protein